MLDKLTHSQLLELKLSDLCLSIAQSNLSPLLKKIECELLSKKISLRPHYWISDEWFTPDGVTGIAIPFYLLHPVLIELEREQMGYVEGESRLEFLRILRHEVGHVMDNGYGLRRDTRRRELFGKSSTAYPTGYTFKPYSRSFVKNLPDGYAQGHPAEDFAETFAVWLDPRSNWKKSYENWPALLKLDLVNTMMKELAGKRPKLICREKYLPLSEQNITLKKFYEKKRRKDGLVIDQFWDAGLKRIFARKGDEKATSFLRKNRKIICREVSYSTGQPQYRVNEMINELVKRSEELHLQKGVASIDDMSYYLSKKMKLFIDEGRHIIAL